MLFCSGRSHDLMSFSADVLPCELTPAVFLSLQLCIHDNYKNNPFHNFRHCFCVTQMMYSMICLCSLQVNTSTHLRLHTRSAGLCIDPVMLA